MQIKTSAEKLLRTAFIGKKFIRSEFCNCVIHDIYDEEVTTPEELSGKVIKDIEIYAYGYREAGIGLKFEEYGEPLFFFGNDTLTVED